MEQGGRTLREQIRDNLASAMEAAGLSQVQLAQRLGISKGTVNNWIRGYNAPDVDMVPRICQALGVPIAALYAGLPGGAALPVPSPPAGLSAPALELARTYERLDQPGRNVVRLVAAEEARRVDAQRLQGREGGESARLIPLYYTPAAAGMTEPAAGEDFDYIGVGPDVSNKADCAIRISGDSMEPYILDGSVVYVTREPLENGDVGIFCLDGDMLCKQYYRDESGNVRLLSLNRARSDADRFIHRNSDSVLTYYGRVLLPRRPMVSWG